MTKGLQEAIVRPIPAVDPDSLAYWAGLRDGVLRLQQCAGCGTVNVYHQAYCRSCGGDKFALKDASGFGAVYSFSIVHRAPGPAFKEDVPYAVALIELDEGPRLISSLIDVDHKYVEIGMRVQLVCTPISEDISLPRFVRAAC